MRRTEGPRAGVDNPTRGSTRVMMGEGSAGSVGGGGTGRCGPRVSGSRLGLEDRRTADLQQRTRCIEMSEDSGQGGAASARGGGASLVLHGGEHLSSQPSGGRGKRTGF